MNGMVVLPFPFKSLALGRDQGLADRGAPRGPCPAGDLFVTTCASAKGAPHSPGGVLVPPAAPEVKDGGRRGSSTAIYTIFCRAGGRNCPRSCTLQPLSDGLFAGGGLGHDPDAASRAGADAPAAPGAEGAASSIAEPPGEASTATSEACTATSESSTATSESSTAHGVAAATAAHSEPPGQATAIAHPTGAADHGWERSKTTPVSAQLDPRAGDTCGVTPLGRGGYGEVEVGVILTHADSSDSFSSEPVGKGQSEQ